MVEHPAFNRSTRVRFPVPLPKRTKPNQRETGTEIGKPTVGHPMMQAMIGRLAWARAETDCKAKILG